jgi:prevent-host-death family protein
LVIQLGPTAALPIDTAVGSDGAGHSVFRRPPFARSIAVNIMFISQLVVANLEISRSPRGQIAVDVMKKLNLAEAKAQLSKLVSDAARGETTVIVRGGRPVARIVPFDEQPRKIKFGTYKGQMVIPKNFDAPDRDAIELLENSGSLFPERKL